MMRALVCGLKNAPSVAVLYLCDTRHTNQPRVGKLAECRSICSCVIAAGSASGQSTGRNFYQVAGIFDRYRAALTSARPARQHAAFTQLKVRKKAVAQCQ